MGNNMKIVNKMISFKDNNFYGYSLESSFSDLSSFYKIQNKTRKSLVLKSNCQLCETGQLCETSNYVNMRTMQNYSTSNCLVIVYFLPLPASSGLYR